MKPGEEILRVLFDNGATAGINADISNELQRLEAEAQQIREAGGHPESALSERVEMLKESIARVTWETAAMKREELDGILQVYEADRDKHAARELMRFESAKNRINALTDAEAQALAFEYASGTTELGLYELREISARLRDKDTAELPMLKDAMQQRRAEMPWIDTPEARTLADEADTLESLPAGSVAFDADGTRTVIDIENLIDWTGALDKPE